MPVQSYKETMDSYALGRRVNMEEWNTISRTQESATALKFGVPVQRGTGDRGCVLFTSGAFLGVSEASQVLPHTGDEYQQYETVPVCESGVIGVECDGAVAAGDPAGFDGTKWVVADTANPQIAGCEFDSSGTDTVVALRVRRQVPTA